MELSSPVADSLQRPGDMDVSSSFELALAPIKTSPPMGVSSSLSRTPTPGSTSRKSHTEVGRVCVAPMNTTCVMSYGISVYDKLCHRLANAMKIRVAVDTHESTTELPRPSSLIVDKLDPCDVLDHL